MTLRRRIALSSGGVLLAALLVLDLVLLGLVNRGQANQIDRTLTSRARSAAAALASASAPPSQALAPFDLQQSDNATETFVEVFDPAGRPLASTGTIAGAPPAVPLSVLQKAANSGAPTTVSAAGVALHVAVVPWGQAGHAGGYVLAGQLAAHLDQQRRGFSGLLFIASAFILLAAGAAS